MSLSKKVKTALDETRLLILGAQVLFGFQLNGAFQEGFADLSQSSKLMTCLGQTLMVLSIRFNLEYVQVIRVATPSTHWSQRILAQANTLGQSSLVPKLDQPFLICPEIVSIKAKCSLIWPRASLATLTASRILPEPM
jgi:hypothetical protein